MDNQRKTLSPRRKFRRYAAAATIGAVITITAATTSLSIWMFGHGEVGGAVGFVQVLNFVTIAGSVCIIVLMSRARRTVADSCR